MRHNANHLRKVETARKQFASMQAEGKYRSLFILQTLAARYFVSVGTIERWVYGKEAKS